LAFRSILVYIPDCEKTLSHHFSEKKMMDQLTFIDILKKDEVSLELPAVENDDAVEELGRGK
jgi:hypothetical protein